MPVGDKINESQSKEELVPFRSKSTVFHPFIKGQSQQNPHKSRSLDSNNGPRKNEEKKHDDNIEELQNLEKQLDDDLLSNSEGETGSTQMSNKIGDLTSPSRGPYPLSQKLRQQQSNQLEVRGLLSSLKVTAQISK